MFKKFKVFALLLLIIGHTILGPIGMVSANELLPVTEPMSEEADPVMDVVEEEAVQEPEAEPEPEKVPVPELVPEPVPGGGSLPETEKEKVPGIEPLPESEENPGPEQPLVEDELNQDIEDANELDESNKETLAKAAAITENILTGVTIKIEDSQGNAIPAADLNSVITVDYTWALKNGHGYGTGSTYTFQLPNELDVYQVLNDYPMKDKAGEIVGYFSFDLSGKATVRFTDYIENYSNVNGTLQVLTSLSEELVVTEGEVIVSFPVEGGASITIPLIYTPAGSSVEKKGTPNRAYNSEMIEWTVDFNKSLGKVNKAVLSDPIQDGQSLEQGSIKLYHLCVKLNGTVTLGAEVDAGDYTIGKTSEGKDFIINFHDDIKTAYRLVYTTNITDENKSIFKNKATLLSDGKQVGEAEATVSVKRGTPLAKRSASYDKASQTITWEIKYNYNEKNIAQADALLKDFFNNTQELLVDSFVVKKITINKDGNEVGSGETVSNYVTTPKSEGGKNGFELQFNENINAAYKIIYKTKATDRVYDKETVVNHVTIGDGKEVPGKQDINQQILFKSHSNANYKNKTVDWTIEFNKDSHEMKDVILTDLFTNNGLTLQLDTIKIKAGNTTLIKDTDYQITKNVQNEFVIKFTQTITAPHIITYTTAFNYEQRANKDLKYLQNKVTLNWKDKDGKSQTKDATSNFTPDGYTQANGFKNGSYNAVEKEITWNVGVNYNLKTLTSASVEDFIQGNQKLLKDTIEVYEMSLTGSANGTKKEKLIPGLDYSISYIDDNGKPGFLVKFNNEITAPYMVSYKTSLKELDLVAAKYDNTATVKNGLDKETDLTASVSIPHGGNYTGKSGLQNGKTINWSVNINFAQSKVSNAKVIDIPNDDQAILEDSIILYATTVGSNGVVNKGAALTKGTDYELDFNETHNPYAFELSFKNEISEPYILEYQSFILKAPASIVNNVKFTGDHVAKEKEVISSTVQVKKTAGMGDGTGELGRLHITKIDTISGVVLEGAKFSLKDKESGSVIKTGITNASGIVAFDRLLWGDYLLVEEEAPNGYLENKDALPITIDKAFIDGDEIKKGNFTTVKNKKIVRAVQLEKVDFDDNTVKLKNAQFILQHKVSNVWQTIELLNTDDLGVIYKGGLEPGDYRFIEQTAPAGYQLDATPHLFSIGEKQLEVIKVGPVTNKVIKGGVKLTKVDKDNTKKVLKGAIFELRDSNGTVIKDGLITADDGAIFVNDLKPGNYSFIETKAPIGYKLDTTPIEFTIVGSQNVIVEKAATNAMILGSVILTKSDEDDSSITLEGAIFDLQDAEGNTKQSGISTNSEGKITVKNLVPGAYQFVEKKAPAYYQLNATPIKFNIEIGENLISVPVRASNKLITGKVELSKVDRDDNTKVVEGAEFELQDTNGMALQSGLLTDAEGKLVVENLKPGDYQLIETKAPFGYDLDRTLIPFTIEKSTTIDQVKLVKVGTTNELTTGSVELTKIDNEDSTITLADAVFKVVNAKGEMVQEGLKTNKDGKLIVSNLKPGNYKFIETKAPFGYDLDPTPIEFTIDKGQKKMLKLSTDNNLTTGSVVLVKVDSDSDKVHLEGAEFTLLDAAGKTLNEKLSTNTEGKIVVDNLKPGAYQFVETKAPFGYELNETPIDFTIVKGQTEARTFNVPNAVLRGSVELTKYDKDNEKMILAGVKFDLQDEKGEIHSSNLVTDETGKIVVDNLKPGNYQFVETETVFGYDLDETPVKFSIKLGATSKVTIEAFNELSTGSVELNKIALHNGNLKLPGAIFELRNDEGNMLQEGLTTDKAGKLVVDKLKPGNYQFVETKAPNGYILDATPIAFEITVGQKVTIQVEKVNRAVPYYPPIEESCNVFTITVKTSGKVVSADVALDLKDAIGKTVATGKTDAKGTITFAKAELEKGSYKAFDKDGNEVGTVTVSYETGNCQATVDLLPKNCEVFTITVVDKPNTVIEVKDLTGKTVVTLTTDKDGIATTSNVIPKGKYAIYVGSEKIGEITIAENCEAVLTPEKPSEVPEKPGNPDNGEIVEEIEKPSNNGNNTGNGGSSSDGGNNKPNKVDTSNKLPQTGEEYFLYMISLGFMLLAAGSVLIFRQRKKV